MLLMCFCALTLCVWGDPSAGSRVCGPLTYLQMALPVCERGLLGAVDGAVDTQKGHVLAGRGAVLPARLVDLQEGARQLAVAR